jgi:hypothetical protein
MQLSPRTPPYTSHANSTDYIQHTLSPFLLNALMRGAVRLQIGPQGLHHLDPVKTGSAHAAQRGQPNPRAPETRRMHINAVARNTYPQIMMVVEPITKTAMSVYSTLAATNMASSTSSIPAKSRYVSLPPRRRRRCRRADSRPVGRWPSVRGRCIGSGWRMP